jgi:integrase
MVKKSWTIPGERMKNNLDHIVPLTNHVLTILKRLRDINGHHKYLFSSKKNPMQPMSESTLNSAIRRMGYDGTGHGVRKIASTTLNEEKFLSAAIERQLSHVCKNKIEGAYNKAKYLTDRAKFMVWWSKYLLDVKSGCTQPVEYQIL